MEGISDDKRLNSDVAFEEHDSAGECPVLEEDLTTTWKTNEFNKFSRDAQNLQTDSMKEAEELMISRKVDIETFKGQLPEVFNTLSNAKDEILKKMRTSSQSWQEQSDSVQKMEFKILQKIKILELKKKIKTMAEGEREREYEKLASHGTREMKRQLRKLEMEVVERYRKKQQKRYNAVLKFLFRNRQN